MKTINVAMVGTGWAGTMHAKGYKHIYGLDCRMHTVCSLEPDLEKFAKEYGFENCCKDYDEMLKSDEIDVIDIVTPPSAHLWMIKKVLDSGKHVICEKPVTGYFGQPGDTEPIGHVDKVKMMAKVMEDMNELEGYVEKSGKQFCYAENWVYSPPFFRAVELICAKKTKTIVINGITGHKGSHAFHAANWKFNGGGALIRQGTHPVAAALYLKRKEAEARGEKYGIVSVLCDASSIMSGLKEKDKGYICTNTFDVEDWSQVVITFADGTKANITAGDVFLGGIINRMEIFCNDSLLTCNMTPNDLLEVYFSDEVGIENEHIMEKNDHNIGFQKAIVAEEIIRGYDGELQDFIHCIANNQKPESGFSLAKETLAVIYGAYLSAGQGIAVDISQWL